MIPTLEQARQLLCEYNHGAFHVLHGEDRVGHHGIFCAPI